MCQGISRLMVINTKNFLGVAMALYEEYDDTQDQLQWLKHLEQERQDLSASVEETLADPSSLPQDQLDDDQPVNTSRKTALIPPRLSLQSKMLPAVRSEGVGQALIGNQQAISSPAQPNTVVAAQGQSVFKRIAQRLTVVFGGTGRDEETDPESEQEKTPLVERSRVRQTALLPAVPALPPYAMNGRTDGAKVIDAVPSVRQPVMPLRAADMTDTGKQRLAGKNTKVRLETVPLPIIPKSVEQVNARAVTPTYGEVREPLDIVLRSRAHSGRISQSGIISEIEPAEEVEIATRSQAEKPLSRENTSTKRGSLSGTATFESGQRECTVKNSNITTTSVAQIMLTANPGPVAVHYVSLQPQIGFTVHLTGPASTKTPFNYVILLGELF